MATTFPITGANAPQPLQVAGMGAPKYPNTTIRAYGPTDVAASDNRVMDMRTENLRKVNEGNANASWWNPWGYVTGAWKAKKAKDALSAPITDIDRQLAAGRAMRPLIEEEMSQKYQPAILAAEQLRNELERSLPKPTKLAAGTGPTGSGSLVTDKSQPTEREKILAAAQQQVERVKGVAKQDAAQLTDEIIISNLQTVVQKPYEIGDVRPGRIARSLLEGVTLGVLGRDTRDPRVIEAERRQFNTVPERGEGFTGDPSEIMEGVPKFAAMFVPYVGLELGAVKIGASLRSVKAIDNFYTAYPYLARTTVANIGVTAGDAIVRSASGQDYGAKDFFLNIALQGVFDKALGTQKARILAHLDNESRILTKELGRAPKPNEILERMGGMTVPGSNFTYGHLFAEQRFAYLNGMDHLAAVPRPDAENRLIYFSGGRGANRIPDDGFIMPDPIPADGQMNAFGEDKPSLFTGGQIQPTPTGGTYIDVKSVRTDPKRFQFRENVHPELGFQEENVVGILGQGFDPKEVRPLEIARFPGKDGTMEEVLVNGHNTLEVLKRQGIEQAESRTINFASEKEAINYARKANLVSKAPEVLQKVRIATSMLQEGKQIDQIAAEMGRIKPSDARRYVNIGYLDPTVQRQVSQGIIDEQLAGILGDATKRLGLSAGVQEQMVQMVAEDKFTPNGLKTWLDIMGKHAASTSQLEGLFGSEEFQVGVKSAIEKVLQTKNEVDNVIRRINSARGLGDLLDKKALSRLEKARAELMKKRDVLEFLILKRSGASAPKLPKGVKQEYIDRIQAEIFSSTPSVKGIDAPGIENSLNIPSGASFQSAPDFLKTAEGTPSASMSTRYVSPSYSTKRRAVIGDDEYVTSVLAASQKNLPTFQRDLEDLLRHDVTAQLKTEASLRGKLVRYKAYDRDIRDISDVLRAQAVVPENEIYQTLESLKNGAAGKEIKLLSVHDYFERPDKGYRGINVKLELPNGQRAELQIHTPESLNIREALHGRYERFRNIDTAALEREQIQAMEAFDQETADIGDRLWSGRAEKTLPDNVSNVAPQKQVRPEEIPGIRLDKMSTEGARSTLKTVMQSNPDLLIARTRGVVSDADAVARANELGVTKDGLLNTPIGATMTKEQITAARMLVSAHGEDVNKLAKMAATEALAGDTTGVQKEYMRALVEHAQLQGVIKGFAAEAGRGLQALKMEISPLERLQGKFFDLLQNADKHQTEALLRQAVKIDLNNPDQVLDFIRKNTRRGWLDMIVEALTAFKVSGVTTHVVNTTSNTIYNAAIPFFRIPVAGIDAARVGVERMLGRKAVRERFFKEAILDMQGMVGKGAKDAFNIPVSDLMGYLKTKYVPFGSAKTGEAEAYLAGIRGSLGETWKALLNESYISGGTVEDIIGRVPAIKGNTGNKYIDTALDAAGKVIRTPFRLLNAEDVAMRTMAKSGEMHVLAARQAFQEGLTGQAAMKRMYQLLEDPPLELLEKATDAAAFRVFQEPMGPLARQVDKLRGIPVVGPMMKIFILPFLKTPANLIKRGFRPFNPAELVRGIKAGGGEASEAIARTTLGSLSVMGLVMYALDGRITGSDPADKKLRDELYDMGWQKYAIRIGDRYYAYDRIEPIQQTIKIAAAIADAYKETGVIDQEMLNAAVMDITKGTLDRSYIRGMNDLLNAAFNPDRYGESFLKSYVAGQPIPAIVGNIKTLMDTDSQGRPIVRETETLTEYAKSRIPGLSPGLKPKLDSAGRAIVRKTGAIESLISPVRSTKAEVSMGEIGKMQEDFRAMKKMSKADREANAEQKHQAMLYIAGLKEIPLEARVQNLKNLKQQNPDLAAEVETMLKNRSKGYTFRDETLKALTVKARAAYMLDALKKMPAEARPQQYKDWKAKNIMTTAVEKELKRLMNVSPSP